MSALFDYLTQSLTVPKPAGAPPATAPISVQNAYQSALRTGAPTSIQSVQQPAPEQAVQPDNQPANDAAYVQGDTFVFPADAYEIKKQEGLSKKAQALGLVNQFVATRDPNEREYYYKALTAQVDAELANQRYELDDFLKKKPAVEAFGKELLNDNTKRSAVAAALSSQLQAVDRPLQKGQDPEDHAASIIRQLQGPWLKTTNGIMGTSDAVAENEADRLMGGANGKWMNMSNLLKQGLSTTEKPSEQLQRYKVVLADAMNSMLNQSNQSFNKLALQSNPEIAQDYLGQETLKPYSGKTIQPLTGVQPRVTRESPAVQSPVSPAQRAVRTRVFSGGSLVDKP